MNDIAISTQIHTLLPGRELPIANGGNVFEILSSTGDVEVKLGQGDFNRLPAGLVVGDPSVYFRDLVLRNISDQPNTIEIYVGTGVLRDNRFVAAGQVEVGGAAFDNVVNAVNAGNAIDLTDRTPTRFYTKGAGVTELIAAADNVNGIELLAVRANAPGTDSISLSHTEYTLWPTTIAGGINNVLTECIGSGDRFERYIIPPRSRLRAVKGGADAMVCGHYRLL